MLNLPVIETNRLQLAPLRQQHSQGMFELWSSEAVCRFSGEATNFVGDPIRLPALTISDSDQIIDFFERHEALGNGFRWAVTERSSGSFVGAFGTNSLGSTIEIAYHQIPEYWGNGFMAEAAVAGIDWLVSEYEPGLFEAYVDPANSASIRLLLRLGFLLADESRDGAVRYERALSPQ